MGDTFRPPHGMGYIRDRVDERDRNFRLYRAVPNVDALPDEVNLEHLLGPAHDQRDVGSCTGWSGAITAYSAMGTIGMRRRYMASPVFLYREAREMGGYVDVDSGTELRLVWKVANKLGMPPMSSLKPRYEARDLPDPVTWKFPERSIWRRKPAASVYARGEARQALSYHRLETLPHLLQCLADGWCATIGFVVKRRFYGADGGAVIDVPDPVQGEPDLGGHAVTAYGYSKARRRIYLRNQWGPTAHRGTPNFTLSFDYMETWSFDWWTVRFIEGGRVLPSQAGVA